MTGDFNGMASLHPAILGNYLTGDRTGFDPPGNGDGSFQAPVAYATAGKPHSIAAGDFNRDGNLDLAVGTVDGPVSILLGNGDATFQPHGWIIHLISDAHRLEHGSS